MGSQIGNRSWREEMLSSETIASMLAFSCQFFLPEVPVQTPSSPVLMLTRPARWVRSSLSWYQQRSPTEDRPDTSLSRVRSGKVSRKMKEERMVAAGVPLEARWELVDFLGPLVVANGGADLREDASKYPPVELEDTAGCCVDSGQSGQLFEFDRPSSFFKGSVAPHSVDDLSPVDIIGSDVYADAGWESSEDCGKLWREWDVEVEDECAGVWMINGKADVEATVRITEEKPFRDASR